MATSKEQFQRLAKSSPVAPPPKWPDFPLPDDVAKRFPSMVETTKEWNEAVRDFFRQQQESQ